jgi:hypothetical protein
MVKCPVCDSDLSAHPEEVMLYSHVVDGERYFQMFHRSCMSLTSSEIQKNAVELRKAN